MFRGLVRFRVSLLNGAGPSLGGLDLTAAGVGRGSGTGRQPH